MTKKGLNKKLIAEIISIASDKRYTEEQRKILIYSLAKHIAKEEGIIQSIVNAVSTDVKSD